MIHRNICPICGNENPEGTEFCQVCKADLFALPDDMFPSEPDPVETPLIVESQTQDTDDPRSASDSSVPNWLVRRFQQNNKPDFDSYANALFGLQTNSNTGSAGKTRRPQKAKNPVSVYQTTFEHIVEPPLVEPDENEAKSVSENIPGLADFLLQRPARKWEEQKPSGFPAARKGTSVSLLHDFTSERPAKKWDDKASSADPLDGGQEFISDLDHLPIWWQEDAPLIESDENALEEKLSDLDDPALANSVSPEKALDAADFFGSLTGNKADHEERTQSRRDSNEFEPENGSLLSDLINEMNSNSGSLTPGEQAENQNGTIFFSGNHPENESAGGSHTESEPDYTEISASDSESTASAAMLDQILRGIGYQVEGEPQPEEKPEKETDKPVPAVPQERPSEPKEEQKNSEKEKSAKPVSGTFVPQHIENPLIETEDELDEKDADPYDLAGDGMFPEKEDFADQDIPWDLFGAADMALPQSPEDPAFRTFSRKGIPEDNDNTAYQQRMISSILGKIIQAENFVRPKKEKNDRYVSFGARLALTAAAICGVIMILMTGITDHIMPAPILTTDESAAFYEFAEKAEGDVLVVMDYTPAYSGHMDKAADSLISTLEEKTDKVYLAVLNPAVMPGTLQLLKRHGEKLEFAGWWPSGVISVRTRISFGILPEQIWLLTSESGSVRSWAEQLAVSGEPHKLHVMTPGQLEPLLDPYLKSEMITSALSRDGDLLHYGEDGHTADRSLMAVWYLAALLPLAWVFGVLSRFFKTEPGYERNAAAKSEEGQQNSDKEIENG